MKAHLDHYYEANWSHVIIAIMGYKNPLVANAHAITSMTAKVDQASKIFFHVDCERLWLST